MRSTFAVPKRWNRTNAIYLKKSAKLTTRCRKSNSDEIRTYESTAESLQILSAEKKIASLKFNCQPKTYKNEMQKV